jgi:FkbM family methyltransferase
MLVNWNDINRYINSEISGVLHVGGHLAEELSIYDAAGINYVIWVEADEERSVKIKNLVPDFHDVVCAVVGDVDGADVVFHEANNGQSSSILDFGTHVVEHPEVFYISETKKTMRRLDALAEEFDFKKFNFLNLDIQGAELLALKGMGNLLDNVTYIYTEINEKSLYDGCCLIPDLDEYLSDFQRVITEMTPFGWGDALYVRV